MSKILSAAKAYVDQGFSVIPIRGKAYCFGETEEEKEDSSKKPLIEWSEFQNRKPTADELQLWFKKWPEANIAIVTGAFSGITVVDLDSNNAVAYTKRHNFPLSPLVKTGRGYQIYYRYKDGTRNFQKRNDLPDIDLRSEGGYAIAPPSIHYSGKCYQWVGGKALVDLPLSEMPEIILTKTPQDKIHIKELYKGVEKGSRNDSLARLTGSWVNDGLSLNDCLDNAFLWNGKNEQPLPEKEVERTVKSIYTKHDRERETKGDKKQPTQAEILLELSKDFFLFHDQHKDPFVFIKGRAVRLSSSKFKEILNYSFYLVTSKAPNSDSINQTVNVLKGKAIFESSQIELHNRVAESENAFWYDMGDDTVMKITATGWQHGKLDKPLFRKYSHQSKQSVPSENGDPWQVFQFLNIGSDHQLLVLVYIVSCYIPGIAHPIFHPHGPQGSGKTTFCRVLKELIDPSALSTLIMQRDDSQLIQAISHHHFVPFDNLSDLPGRSSDILAIACTGGGLSKRQLYTDEDDIVLSVRRCIGLNAINLLISRADLMDRSILLHLDSINPSVRRDETEFWKAFNKCKSDIIGGLLDTLSKAIGIYPGVHLERLPRMADFAKWGYAIGEALKKGGGNAFLQSYQANINRQIEEITQSNTLILAILKLMSKNRTLEGTIKSIHAELLKVAEPDTKDPTFPKTERSLRRHLERAKTTLLQQGISYAIGQRTAEGVPISFSKTDCQEGQELSTPSTFDAQDTPHNVNNEGNADNAHEFPCSWKSGQEVGEVALQACQGVTPPYDKASILEQQGKTACLAPEQQYAYQERSAVMKHDGRQSRGQPDEYAWCLEVCLLSPGQRELCERVKQCPKGDLK